MSSSGRVRGGKPGIGRVDQGTADVAIQTALDYGVNHIDVAPSYGEAELRFGPWMPKIRDQVFLGCKTNIRDAEGSWAECNRSLERLNTQSFDLYQLHSVGKRDILDEVTAKGGATGDAHQGEGAGPDQIPRDHPGTPTMRQPPTSKRRNGLTASTR